jgi:hypothetical protein
VDDGYQLTERQLGHGKSRRSVSLGKLAAR